MRDKLESSDGWETVQTDQSLHELILKIERICVSFDDHKQEVYNLVQVVNTLFLYTQIEKESVGDYSRNLTSMWDTDEAFGASPGMHRGLVRGCCLPNQGVSPTLITLPMQSKRKLKLKHWMRSRLHYLLVEPTSADMED